MKKIAVITGASSGLGREFVRQIAVKEKDQIDEIWAVARREDRLKALQSESEIPVIPVPMDLTIDTNYDILEKKFKEDNVDIRILVCAAGFGRIGSIKEISLKDNRGMIDLNCKAAVAVTTIAVPHMSKGSRILEICSTAGFQPMPRLGVYSATKAFLQCYTKDLHHELLTSGIHVTAVCPYWIKDTEFIPNAQKQQDLHSYHHFFLANRAKTVTALALNDSKLNLWVSTPGLVCFLHRIAAKFIPHCIMVPLMELLRHVL